MQILKTFVLFYLLYFRLTHSFSRSPSHTLTYECARIHPLKHKTYLHLLFAATKDKWNSMLICVFSQCVLPPKAWNFYRKQTHAQSARHSEFQSMYAHNNNERMWLITIQSELFHIMSSPFKWFVRFFVFLFSTKCCIQMHEYLFVVVRVIAALFATSFLNIQVDHLLLTKTGV